MTSSWWLAAWLITLLLINFNQEELIYSQIIIRVIRFTYLYINLRAIRSVYEWRDYAQNFNFTNLNKFT